MDSIEEAAAYRGLVNEACRAYARIASDAASPTDGDSARFISAAATAFVDATSPSDEAGPAGPAGPASTALRLLADEWPRVRHGEISGEQLFASTQGLWVQLMCEWPMGAYGHLLAQRLATSDLRKGWMLELGAGVGHTSRQVRAVVAEDATVFATDVAFAGRRQVDFDAAFGDLLPQRPDVVYATNALHCARDPQASLRFAFEALADGGAIVLSEGAPFPRPGEPWALTALFGLFQGWYDRAGFRTREYWAEALGACGFTGQGFDEYVVGPFDLGGVVYAFKQ